MEKFAEFLFSIGINENGVKEIKDRFVQVRANYDDINLYRRYMEEREKLNSKERARFACVSTGILQENLPLS